MRPACVLLLAAALALADPPRKMTLVFEDNFDGAALDPAKWHAHGGDAHGDVRVSEGKVRLSIYARSKDMRNGTRIPTLGSGITSHGRFEQAQGYFEASIRFAPHDGHTGGFRLIADRPEETDGKFQEIYVAQSFAADTTATWRRYGYGKSYRDDETKDRKHPLPPGKARDNFNTYGMLWTAREISWYINGRKFLTSREDIQQEKLYLSIHHMVEEREISRLDPAKPAEDLEVDWVKVWR